MQEARVHFDTHTRFVCQLWQRLDPWSAVIDSLLRYLMPCLFLNIKFSQDFDYRKQKLLALRDSYWG